MTPSIPTLKQIADAVGRATGVDPRAMYGTDRKREPSFARHLLWHVANVHCGRSQSWIGKNMGRDHTTVRTALIRFEAKLVRNENARVLLDVALGFLAAQSGDRPAPREFAPVRIVGPVCSQQWWASNDANFRAGMARAALAAKQAKFHEFVHMGKSVDKLNVADAGCKSPLALPRNLHVGLQSPTPDLRSPMGP